MTDEFSGEHLPGDTPSAGAARLPGEQQSSKILAGGSSASAAPVTRLDPEPPQNPSPRRELTPAELTQDESTEDGLTENGWPPWPKPEPQNWDDISTNELGAYPDTIRRVERITLAAGFLCTVAAFPTFGWLPAAGVLLGTLMGWLNFRWLASSVKAIGERVAQVKPSDSAFVAVIRGVSRGVLILIVGCVILTCSVRALVGYLAGLAMPVVALMCEAVYEFVAVNRRSS
jgi:hypothetical protein